MVPTFEEIQRPYKVLFKTIFEGYLVTQTFKQADFFAIDRTVQYASGQRYYASHLFRNDLYIVNSRDALLFKIYFKALEV